jgi:hypothetical protein
MVCIHGGNYRRGGRFSLKEIKFGKIISGSLTGCGAGGQLERKNPAKSRSVSAGMFSQVIMSFNGRDYQ